MRRSALFAALVAAVAATASAHGAVDGDALIRPGVGIGKVRLGMAQAQVFRLLGRPSVVNRRLTYGFGMRYVEYDWGFGTWTVGFTGRRGDLRVSKIGTTLRRERTARRVGVDSTARAVLRAFPNASCVLRVPPSPNPGVWIYVGRRPAITAFNVHYSGNARRGKVAEVVVQRQWIGASRGLRCPPDWRTR